MKSKIRANVKYNGDSNILYYQDFEIVEEMPKIGGSYNAADITAIEPIRIDSEQPSMDQSEYEYYHLTAVDDEGNETDYYIAINQNDALLQELKDADMDQRLKDICLHLIKSDVDDLTDKDIEYLVNSSQEELDASNDIIDWVDVFREIDYIARDRFELWTDYNENYPNNPYLSGVILNGYRYATSYSGVAGEYWRDDKDSPWWLYLGKEN